MFTQGEQIQKFNSQEKAPYTDINYLNKIQQLITAYGSDSVNTSWITERRAYQHCALPYSTEPYDFLAINTPSSYEQGAIPTKEEPPIGMLRVVASAHEDNFLVGSLDAHALNMSIEQIRSQLQKIKPKIVGLNPTSVNVPEAKALALLCDSMGIHYILGGVHATLDPHIAKHDFPNAYAIVRGDGEVPILSILHNFYNQKNDALQGVYYQTTTINSKMLPYAPKTPIQRIPFIKQENFAQYPIVEQSITLNDTKYTVLEGSLYCTRGCPFECGFCASPIMVGRGIKGVRPYDHPGMNRVIDEIEHMLTIGANAIHFLDDMIFISNKDVHLFHSGLQHRGLIGKFIWRGMTRAPVVSKTFGQETLQRLVDSGCWRMTLGVESGNNDVLRAINKKITTEDVELAVKKLISVGIQVKCFFIMGFPGETYSQMIDTYNFVMKLKDWGLSTISIFQFKPYPGTSLWGKIARNNPEALRRLNYIGGDARNIVRGNRAVQGVYLPDDLIIADGVPSGKVRELVNKTLNNFFS